VSADPFDPLETARRMRDSGFESWAKATQQITSSTPYARAMNALSQPGLLATALLRKAVEKAMVQLLARLSLPSREDVSAISQRLTRIEMVLDDLGAAVESLRAAPSQTPKAQPTVARPRGAA
jgi:BMFP domain-containing protein YqiC